MKNKNLNESGFRTLDIEESRMYNGGGFAYDAGRFLRFVAIAGPSGAFTPMAIMDAIANQA